MTENIFVFGSNLAGRHGKGAALTAVKCYGAQYGQGIGRQGRSYAIPTKDANLRTLPLRHIAIHVATFVAYTRRRPELTFMVTQIGCGLAGYTPADVAPYFRRVPDNVLLPAAFLQELYGKVDDQRLSFNE